jgi:hypothetical protein
MGSQVLEVVELPDSDDCVAVLDPMDRPPGIESWHPFDNLVRLRPTGEVVWVAHSPSDMKSWTTGLQMSDGRLIASAWSDRCEVDPATGLVLRRWFVK